MSVQSVLECSDEEVGGTERADGEERAVRDNRNRRDGSSELDKVTFTRRSNDSLSCTALFSTSSFCSLLLLTIHPDPLPTPRTEPSLNPTFSDVTATNHVEPGSDSMILKRQSRSAYLNVGECFIFCNWWTSSDSDLSHTSFLTSYSIDKLDFSASKRSVIFSVIIATSSWGIESPGTVPLHVFEQLWSEQERGSEESEN